MIQKRKRKKKRKENWKKKIMKNKRKRNEVRTAVRLTSDKMSGGQAFFSPRISLPKI